MQVAVIGGGVVGVCTAYFLAEAGHEVVVVERHNNVAERASFGNAGVLAPGQVAPWATPGMPGKLLSYLFRSSSPVKLKPSMSPALWRWVRLWMDECRIERFQLNRERMQRVAYYSSSVLQELCSRHQLEFERTSGYLQLYRREADLRKAQPALELLGDYGPAFQVLDAEAARAIEPGLSPNADLAGALYLPEGEAGNCPLFTKQLKLRAQALGVDFHFNTEVRSIAREDGRIALNIDERRFHADAVVLAAGADSAKLLASLGIKVPMYPVKGYSATAPIRNFDEAPLAALMDESSKIAITRMGARIRIAGTAEVGSSDLHDAAMRTLIKVADRWFPNAANYNAAQFWCGARPMLPDGAPLLGATPIRNVFINIGHGSCGWAMAAGSGRILADIVSGRAAEIDMDGLTLSRYG
jgi:D-amino-acid dehydrogenase